MPAPASQPTPDYGDLGFVPAGGASNAHADLGFVPTPSDRSARDPRAQLADMAGEALGGAAKWLQTPFDGWQPTLDERKRQNPGGIIGKDSSDVTTAIGSFLSGIPGFDRNAISPEAEERMGRFRSEHPIASFLLPAAGGFGKPAMLPGTASGAPAASSAFADTLEQAGIKAGRRALSGGGTISVSKPLSDAAVKEALDSGAIKFGGTLQGAAKRLGALRKDVGGQYAQIVSELEAAGVKGPQAQSLAGQYAQAGAEAGSETMNPAVPQIYRSAAEQVGVKPADAGGFLSLSRAEKLKQSLQDQARSAYKQLQPNEVGQAHEATASMMRQAVEDAIQSQKGAAPVLAEAFRPVKERLGNIISASDVANTAAARASRNRAFSLTDTIAGAGGIAAGEPITAAASVIGNKLIRSRGASSVAVAAMGGASMVRKMTRLATESPEQLGKFAPVLLNAARRGEDASAAVHYVLSQDPDYQQAMHAAAEGQ